MCSISVLTLNCWGIGMGVSKDRVARFRAIAQHLADSDYDIVCLQEVWCPSDYRTIIDVARDVLPFNHFFDNGIIGTGTCILSKAPIQDATFHEFSLNGYPHKVLHGDWFAGKGLGVCGIDYKGLNIHVFVSHFHAEYSRSDDIYLGHRVMQALEAAQWIKLTSSGADLTIYAGDFNTEPVDVPYSLLRSVGSLSDSWVDAHGVDGGETCGTPYNTYCTISEVEEYPAGKRIDYIMYRAGPDKTVQITECRLPLARRIPASLSACLGKEVSYSDHEAVAATITVTSSAGAGGDNLGHSARQARGKMVGRQEAVAAGIILIEKALLGTKTDQKLYSVLAIITFIIFMASFSQLLLMDSLLLDCTMFLLRMILTLTGFYAVLMASVFNRRERHALSATKATLQLLKTGDNYGSI